MLNNKFALLVFVVLLACGQRRQYPINEINVSSDFYENALEDINEEVGESPFNVQLRYKRLYINALLKWPEKANEDLSYIIKKEGLSQLLYDYGVSFYKSSQQYEKLLELTEQWETLSGELDAKSRIIALAGLERQKDAANHLWDLLQNNKSDSEMLQFAAEYYELFKDTARAIYAYNLLYLQQPNHPVLFARYVPLLLSEGKPEVARLVVDEATYDSESYKASNKVAEVIYQLGDRYKAHRLLASFNNPEVIYQRVSWFREEKRLDSAIFLIDHLIAQDSSVKALMTKAKLSEERGLLQGAHQIYQAILEKDSTNSIAIESDQIVERKIAYLRSLRERERKIPVLEITRKKATDNE